MCEGKSTNKLLYFDTEKEAINFLKENNINPTYPRTHYIASLCMDKNTGEEAIGCETAGHSLTVRCSDCISYKQIKPNKWFIAPHLHYLH